MLQLTSQPVGCVTLLQEVSLQKQGHTKPTISGINSHVMCFELLTKVIEISVSVLTAIYANLFSQSSNMHRLQLANMRTLVYGEVNILTCDLGIEAATRLILVCPFTARLQATRANSFPKEERQPALGTTTVVQHENTIG